MRFAEKLDLIMNITKTSNSTLARYTALDASHISRLRRGQRQLPQRENYLEAMADYFAKRCLTENHHELLKHVLGIEELPQDQARIARVVQRWLSQESSNGKTVAEFLGHMSKMTFKKEPLMQFDEVVAGPLLDDKIEVCYGVEGKRQAVIAFLSQVVSEPQPQTLYLYSDEDTGWQFGDAEFITRWAQLMVEVIKRGNRIKVIHTVSRDLDDMLTAIREWMPLHMTGAIESYYYPKKRDGVFKRTLFLAPKSAAVISTSVGNMSHEAANFLIRNKQAIAAVSQEYDNYLAMCRPLMRIYTAANKTSYFNTLLEFEKEPADIFIGTDSLSILTMPLRVAEQVVLRADSFSVAGTLDLFAARARQFERQLQGNRYTEIIKLPEITSIKNGRLRLAFSDFLYNQDVFYTANEYVQHLQNIIYLLQKYANFNICISRETKPVGYLTYVKEDVGAIIAKTTAPAVITALNESNLTAAFWDFLDNQINKVATNKTQTIARLEFVISRLQPGLSASL